MWLVLTHGQVTSLLELLVPKVGSPSLSQNLVFLILCADIYPAPSSNAHPTARAFVTSKQAFYLACIEQLIPVLSPATIEKYLFPLCLP